MNETVDLSSFLLIKTEPLCSECGESWDSFEHSFRNHRGHFFNSEGATIHDRRDLHDRAKQERPTIIFDPTPPCLVCDERRRRGRHRGRGSHGFDPTGPEHVILLELERALQASGRATVIRIRPRYAYGVGEIVTVHVEVA